VTRIVAGSAGGRRLTVPPTAATRPTSDRAREALFSALEAQRGTLVGTRVLDLYAGSGALGLEAASRGASEVLCVESDARAATVIRRNASDLGLLATRVVCDRVERFLARTPDEPPFDIVLADPPYALVASDLDEVLESLAGQGWLAPDAIVVVERATRSAPLTWPAGIESLRQRRYGEATLWYGRAGFLPESAPAQRDSAREREA
jgi:16S rRNA (guanine966-N2)-methyltransferase